MVREDYALWREEQLSHLFSDLSGLRELFLQVYLPTLDLDDGGTLAGSISGTGEVYYRRDENRDMFDFAAWFRDHMKLETVSVIVSTEPPRMLVTSGEELYNPSNGLSLERAVELAEQIAAAAAAFPVLPSAEGARAGSSQC